jgi:hypothetical protein
MDRPTDNSCSFLDGLVQEARETNQISPQLQCSHNTMSRMDNLIYKVVVENRILKIDGDFLEVIQMLKGEGEFLMGHLMVDGQGRRFAHNMLSIWTIVWHDAEM